MLIAGGAATLSNSSGQCYKQLIYDVPFEWNMRFMCYVRHPNELVEVFSAQNYELAQAGVAFKSIADRRHRRNSGANTLWISYRGDGPMDEVLPVRVTVVLQLPEPDLSFQVGPAT